MMRKMKSQRRLPSLPYFYSLIEWRLPSFKPYAGKLRRAVSVFDLAEIAKKEEKFNANLSTVEPESVSTLSSRENNISILNGLSIPSSGFEISIRDLIEAGFEFSAFDDIKANEDNKNSRILMLANFIIYYDKVDYVRIKKIKIKQ